MFSKIRSLRLFLLAVVFLLFPFSRAYPEKPIVILTTSYNNKLWVKQSLASIYSQEYSNYRVIYVDDASQDGTADMVEEFIGRQNRHIRFDLIRNRERLGALENIYYAIHNFCEDDEIIVSLDGDDWFYDSRVLKKINMVYSGKKVWLTHGTMIEFPSQSTKWSRPIPKSIISLNAFRQFRCPSHLRTFYAWLFKKIKIEDLQYEGKFFAMTWDQAMMFPMIEMAGVRHAFIPRITYVYNMSNPINDNKVDPQLQMDLEVYIRSKTPYAPLLER